jgi:hypothetical protein
VAPHARDAAAPLVRLLVLDDRASEALSAARTFSALSTDTLWAGLLQGLAYHAMADNGAAERSFIHALGRMDESTRRRWADPTWLLDYREQRELRAMDARQRAEYERRFWIVSNPLWLTPANERWVEHMARHATARLLADAPRVMGSYRWGPDLDQLTIRYGSPAARAQVRGNNPWDASTSLNTSIQRSAHTRLNAGCPPASQRSRRQVKNRPSTPPGPARARRCAPSPGCSTCPIS